jgi:hypothetical protein
MAIARTFVIGFDIEFLFALSARIVSLSIFGGPIIHFRRISLAIGFSII